ncbi:MAG TPA: hypothetical protein VK021_08130 [Flavobacteriaceae bacterium]|nr:hypothetical protein [Flavobacteriaceae bacterium]
MKQIILILSVFLLCACSKDDDNQSLPPATEYAAGTFACYVDGKPFIDNSGGWFNCYYQFVEGEYYFAISGKSKVNALQFMVLATEAKTIAEGETLYLTENEMGNAWAGSSFYSESISYQFVETNSEYTGELTITKFDLEENIVSGTFWFDLEHPITGEKIEIREGRFDTYFTQ